MIENGKVPEAISAGLNGRDGVPSVEPAPDAVHRPAAMSVFAKRVASVLATRVTLFVMAFATSILLSRLLGPDGKGAYVAVVTLPGMLAAVGLFGLPGAVNYFAGRGASIKSLIRATYASTAVLSVLLVGVVWFSLPVLETSILRAAPDNLVRVILLAVPLGILTTFGGSLLYGRQAVRVYNLIQISLAAVSLMLVVVLVGFLRLGVNGAVAGAVAITVLTAVAVMVAVHRLGRSSPGGPPSSLGGMASYAARLYPSSLSGYFVYRADTYIIQALMLGPQAALGLYSMAVTMAELVFYVPDSITTIFLPRVAGSTPDEANRLVGRVGRLTTLLTIAVALVLIPAGFLGIHLVLPKFVDCLPAFVVLLPGVISLSVAKVMTSYVNGRGHPGLVAIGTVASLVLNVALNLVLIPRFGIVGASLSSLISYTFQAGMAVIFASRLSGQSPLSLFVPGTGEIRLLVETGRRLMANTKARRRGPEGQGNG
ncbi:MAG TPA: polysaccharide biosynthesis C-terminal domain-containing protein [Candidatus Limnocylindrales bacterium]